MLHIHKELVYLSKMNHINTYNENPNSTNRTRKCQQQKVLAGDLLVRIKTFGKIYNLVISKQILFFFVVKQ